MIEAGFVYYTGDVASLGRRIQGDIEPLDELIRVNPQKTSVNVWIGEPGYYQNQSPPPNAVIDSQGCRRLLTPLHPHPTPPPHQSHGAAAL